MSDITTTTTETVAPQRLAKNEICAERDIISGQRGSYRGSKFLKAISKWAPSFKAAKVADRGVVVQSAINDLLQSGFRFLAPGGEDDEGTQFFTIVTDRKKIAERLRRAMRKIINENQPKSLKNTPIAPKLQPKHPIQVQAAATATRMDEEDTTTGSNQLSSSPSDLNPPKAAVVDKVPANTNPTQQVELHSTPSLSFTLSDGCVDGMLSAFCDKDGSSFAGFEDSSGVVPQEEAPAPLAADTATATVTATAAARRTSTKCPSLEDPTRAATSGKASHAHDADNVSELTDVTTYRRQRNGGTGMDPKPTTSKRPSSDRFFQRGSHGGIGGGDARNEATTLGRSSSLGIGSSWADEDHDDFDDHETRLSSSEYPTSYSYETKRGTNQTIVTEETSSLAAHTTTSGIASSAPQDRYDFVSHQEMELLEQKIERNLYSSCTRAFGRLDKRMHILKQENVELRDLVKANQRDNQDLRERLAILEYMVKNPTSLPSKVKCERSHRQSRGPRW